MATIAAWLWLAASALLILRQQHHAVAYVVESNLSECINCMNATSPRFDDLHKRLLAQIGISNFPPSSMVVPERLQQEALRAHLFSTHSNTRSHDKSTTTIQVIARPGLKHGLPTAVFDFSRETRRQRVMHGALSFHLRAPSSAAVDPAATVPVHIHERSTNGKLGRIIASNRFAVPRDPAGSTLLISIESDDIVSWWHNESDVDGIFVSALFNGENLAVHPSDADHHATKSMVLGVKLRDAPSRRARAARQCVDADDDSSCCLHDLFVDFKILGWNFIVAPQRYNAYACTGDCVKSDMQLLHTKAVASGVVTRESIAGNTCCHASQYDPLEIVYVTAEGEVVIANVEGLVAKECTCA